MKLCKKCGVTKDLSEFSIKNKKTGTHNAWCKPCNRAYQKEHYKANFQVYRSKARAWEAANGGKDGKRLRNYGLTEEQFEVMFAKFGGKCWMCREREALVVDHDHSCCSGISSCGKCVRGLLCSQCNTGLGFLGDTVASVERALNYLAK